MTSAETDATPPANQTPERHQVIGRILGPLLFVVMLLTESSQDTMSPLAWRVAAVGIWMAIWWATE
ncbi:MAG: hypothetical protein WD078_12485, partial [Woeseia sp.]